MLLLRPQLVTFDGVEWRSVEKVVIERRAAKTVEAWSDGGPHVVFVDVPEQKVVVRVTQELACEDLDEPKPGELGELRFETALNGSSAGRTAVVVTGVVVGVSYGVSRGGVSTRVVELVAVSGDGVGVFR
ncbi:MAG: hypothetical protein CMJ31_13165 [Phycisphaerae bacterium]|nr:hypothetical protein [Phycisphaerae bacterium]